MTTEFAKVLGKLLARTELGEGEVREAFGAILTGQWTPIQVAGFAVALRMKGESPAVIVEAAQAMRAAMVAVEHSLPVVVDTCGTGGDGAHTLNLSSGAALIVAACGLPVAKHGNRSISSRCGSADVFEALGVPLDVPPARQGDVLREAGIAFLFAPAHHGALKHAGQARKELGVRTIFNALGPLANPARATHQLVGVYEDSLRPIVARALGLLGLRSAWVVRGEDGLDEVSPCGPTRVSALSPDGQVRELTTLPQDFGVETMQASSIAGGDAAGNAQALVDILEGKRHPAREAVVLNAAAALHVATGEDRRACADKARSALDSGAAMQVLERWRRAAKGAKEA
jgi:anthranilate phosphoribosyltransferase